MLEGKRILLGITGGIAAYKTTFLVRLLVKAGAEVRIVMTESAGHFVSALTLATLSKNEVVQNFVKSEAHTTAWNNHVELGLWADLMVIAPATANTLSKMASGEADNLLLACYLSAKCPVFFAPAMDLDMFQHPSTKHSIARLQSFGNHLIPAESGELASGLSGEGRMAEPEHILEALHQHFEEQAIWKGKTVLITAGPTYEAIDPVRFVGNHASGKMGFALAEAAANLGARVLLITGPTALNTMHPFIERVSVTSADQMYTAVMERFQKVDIAIAAAAVADYRPKTVAGQKIKKKTEELSLELVKNKDILLAMGKEKSRQFLVGFALETENELQNAKDKLGRKNLDAIVLNTLNDPGAGFGGNQNKVTFIDKNNAVVSFELKEKSLVAEDILQEIDKRLDA